MKINFRFMILWIVLLIYGLSATAQDIIVFNDGSVERVKVLEINANEIKYKKWDNLEGPLYSVDKSKIMTINYQNGTSEKFSQQDHVEQQQFVSTPDLEYDRKSPSSLRLGDKYLTEQEAEKLLYYQGENIYKNTWLEATKQRRNGTTMLFIGLGVWLGCGITGGIDLSENGMAYPYLLAASSAGFSLWVAGIIFNSIGNHRMDWTLRTYNNGIKHGNNKTASLSFGATNNGIGLQLKF